MQRDKALDQLANNREQWDFLVIGGGATGLGTAVDAASRGWRTLLVEQHDFAKGTSSRSTKLVHGGVRYLQQGNISLVLEALHERGLLCGNAPHLVHHLSFIVPVYKWWEGPFYGIGMKIYDRLAGSLGLSPSRVLSRKETILRIPTVEQRGLQGGVCYYDGQFDDSRLAVNLAQTVFEAGGTALNYMKVTGLLRERGLVCGARLRDGETGEEHEIRASAVINATGVFCDGIRRMDEPGARSIVTASQGAHLVLPKEFLPGDSAIMVPHTPDGRVLFVVPWHDHIIAGTTDVSVDNITLEPAPMDQEIDFILANAGKYLARRPVRKDVLSAYAGLRPLVKVTGARSTAALSRDHAILVSKSGLLTITGGKWTTYRKMGEDAVDRAATIAGFDPRPCVTAGLRIHGWTDQGASCEHFGVYGADSVAIRKLLAEDKNLGKRIHPDLPYHAVEVAWAAREEMARTVEDVLARRTRALLLGARASIEAAPQVAAILARELKRGSAWEQQTVKDYARVARRYVIK
jgi:glycerol-3-phosphate dehydrogenase